PRWTLMKKITLSILAFALSAGLLLVCRAGVFSDDRRVSGPEREGKGERPYGIAQRALWTASRLSGTPHPPPPYKSVRSFPKLTFKNPLLITMAPGSNRFFVGEQAGKLFSFPNDQDCARADLFLDLTTEVHNWDATRVKNVEAVYGLAFHPQFA